MREKNQIGEEEMISGVVWVEMERERVFEKGFETERGEEVKLKTMEE